MRVFVLAFALVACGASSGAPRGDWCGTERAALGELGRRTEACRRGDFFGCAEARTLCESRGVRACDDLPPGDAGLDACVAGEALEGAWCDASAENAALAAPGLRERLAKACADDVVACWKLGLVDEHGGRDPDASYERACEHGVAPACARRGDRARAHGDARANDWSLRACRGGARRGCDALDELVRGARDDERAGRWDDVVRIYRLACFAWSRSDACDALDDFRARARREAMVCESGEHEACGRASAMIRAASQGPRDDARADALSPSARPAPP